MSIKEENEFRERAAKLATHLRETIGAYYGEVDGKPSHFPTGDILTALAALSGTLVTSMPEELRVGAIRAHLEIFSNACGATVTPIQVPNADDNVGRRVH